MSFPQVDVESLKVQGYKSIMYIESQHSNTWYMNPQSHLVFC